MKRTSFAKTLLLPMAAALAVGLLACGGGSGGQSAQTAAPAPNPGAEGGPAPHADHGPRRRRDAGAPEGGPDWGIAAKMRIGFRDSGRRSRPAV